MNILDQIAAVIGQEHLLRGFADKDRYECDGRGNTGRALAVARPKSTSQVSSIIRLAAAAGVHVIPQGGRTGLVGAGLPDNSEEMLILSLERLAGQPQIDPLNRTAEVEAGLSLSSLNEAAGEHGLFFPIDLGADPSIGGMIATNTGGARFIRYGDVRSNLLSIEVVLSDSYGTVVTLGKNVRKDNSGLDLKQLFVGGSGSMGVITKATLALSPLCAASVTALLALRNCEVAIELLNTLERQFGTLLSAFEGISGPALSATLDNVPNLHDPFGGARPIYSVLVELSAAAAFDESWLEEKLAAAIEPYISVGKVVDAVTDQKGRLWSIRHGITEGLAQKGRVIACDIAIRRGDIGKFRRDVEQRIRVIAPELLLHDFGHIGDGGLHFNFVWPHGATRNYDPEVANRVRQIVLEAAAIDYGGTFSAEHGVGPLNARQYRDLVAKPSKKLAGDLQRIVAPTRMGRINFCSDET